MLQLEIKNIIPPLLILIMLPFFGLSQDVFPDFPLPFAEKTDSKIRIVEKIREDSVIVLIRDYNPNSQVSFINIHPNTDFNILYEKDIVSDTVVIHRVKTKEEQFEIIEKKNYINDSCDFLIDGKKVGAMISKNEKGILVEKYIMSLDSPLKKLSGRQTDYISKFHCLRGVPLSNRVDSTFKIKKNKTLTKIYLEDSDGIYLFSETIREYRGKRLKSILSKSCLLPESYYFNIFYRRNGIPKRAESNDQIIIFYSRKKSLDYYIIDFKKPRYFREDGTSYNQLHVDLAVKSSPASSDISE